MTILKLNDIQYLRYLLVAANSQYKYWEFKHDVELQPNIRRY